VVGEVSPVVAVVSPVVPVESVPDPEVPRMAWFAARASFGLTSDPPHAVGTSMANPTRHAPTNLLRTAELLTPVCEPASGTHIT
jgi:hypothetical protein